MDNTRETRKTTTRLWRVSERERDALVAWMRRAWDWPAVRAKRECDACRSLVAPLHQKTRGCLPPAEIWQVVVMAIIEVGSGAGNYCPEMPLVAYVARCAARAVRDQARRGPSGRPDLYGFDETEKETRRRARRLASKPVSLDQPGGSVMLDQLCSPSPEALLLAEADGHLERLHHCLPTLACRLEGNGVDAWPAWRERQRRQHNPARVGVPVSRAALSGRSQKGAHLRVGTARAGLRLLRRQGTSLCRCHATEVVRLAASWKSGRARDPEAAAREYGRKFARRCEDCPRAR